MTEPPLVLYLAGSGRSGSTVVERTLGAVPGFVNVGETVYLFRNVIKKSLTGAPVICGCGEQVLECPFWSAVGDEAFGGWNRDLVDYASSLQAHVVSQRRMPQMLAGRGAGQAFVTQHAEYVDLFRRLYAAVLHVSGARAVVDASKWPGQGLALSSRPGLDVRYLHLVRDVRGVAYSWAKAGVVRPASGERQELMTTYNPMRTAARWTVFQLEVSAISRSAASALVRYEDFAVDPAGALSTALSTMGIPVEPGAFSHVDGRTVTLGRSHGVAGNPSRFRNGQIELNADVAWRQALPRSRQVALAAVGLPGLATCGYIRSQTTR